MTLDSEPGRGTRVTVRFPERGTGALDGGGVHQAGLTPDPGPACSLAPRMSEDHVSNRDASASPGSTKPAMERLAMAGRARRCGPAIRVALTRRSRRRQDDVRTRGDPRLHRRRGRRGGRARRSRWCRATTTPRGRIAHLDLYRLSSRRRSWTSSASATTAATCCGSSNGRSGSASGSPRDRLDIAIADDSTGGDAPRMSRSRPRRSWPRGWRRIDAAMRASSRAAGWADARIAYLQGDASTRALCAARTRRRRRAPS